MSREGTKGKHFVNQSPIKSLHTDFKQLHLVFSFLFDNLPQIIKLKHRKLQKLFFTNHKNRFDKLLLFDILFFNTTFKKMIMKNSKKKINFTGVSKRRYSFN